MCIVCDKISLLDNLENGKLFVVTHLPTAKSERVLVVARKGHSLEMTRASLIGALSVLREAALEEFGIDFRIDTSLCRAKYHWFAAAVPVKVRKPSNSPSIPRYTTSSIKREYISYDRREPSGCS